MADVPCETLLLLAHDRIAVLEAEVARLREDRASLIQQIEDTVAVAQTDEDADGFISAYHFKTGAIHRLLARIRTGERFRAALAGGREGGA